MPTEFAFSPGRGVLHALQGDLSSRRDSITLLHQPLCDQTLNYPVDPVRISPRIRNEDIGRSFDFAISRSLTPRPCPGRESAPYGGDHALPFGRWIALSFEEQWRDTFFLAPRILEGHLVEKNENRNVESVSISEFHPLRRAGVEGRRGGEKYSCNGTLDP